MRFADTVWWWGRLIVVAWILGGARAAAVVGIVWLVTDVVLGGFAMVERASQERAE